MTETKYCLYSGEPFIPKRRDQKFASEENRYAYHNAKAYEERKFTNQHIRKLIKNYRVLLCELDKRKWPKHDIEIESTHLIPKGFDGTVISGLVTDGREYWFSIFDIYIKFNNHKLIIRTHGKS